MQRERVVLGERGAQQAPQLLLVAGRRDDQVRQLALRRQREHALVAGAVLAHEAGPVDADDHRRIVLADVVDDLVEGALEERGVERDDGPLAAEREARGERHRVLLGDAHVVHPVRERGAELAAGRCPWACPR